MMLLVYQLKYFTYPLKQTKLTKHLLQFESALKRHKDIKDVKQLTENNSKKTGSIMKILYYTVFMNRKHWFGLGRAPFANCEYTTYETTDDKAQLATVDAVLVNDVDIPRDFINEVPERRNVHQKWILSMSESPINTMMHYGALNGIFNLTLNYKQNSDLYTPEFVIAKRNDIQAPLRTNFARGKTKLVVWFSSHCNTQSKREDYVKQLQSYIAVDIYGTCGSLKCPKDFYHLNYNYGPNECDLYLNSTYKFYLSFEIACVQITSQKRSHVFWNWTWCQ